MLFEFSCRLPLLYFCFCVFLCASICAPTSNEFTHLILEKTGRTAKVLFALARGAWILKADYISACLDAGRFLPELEFLIPDLANARLARERLAKLALPASGAGRASSSSDGGSDNSDSSSSHGGLLTLQNDSFRRVYMHGELVMSSAVMSELIAACGGLTVSTFAQCTICISAVPLPAGKTKGGANAPIVTPEVRSLYRPVSITLSSFASAPSFSDFDCFSSLSML